MLGETKASDVEDDQHWAHVRIDAATGRVVPHFLVEHLRDVGDGAATLDAFAQANEGFGAPYLMRILRARAIVCRAVQ